MTVSKKKFSDAVKAIPELSVWLKLGLQAVKNRDRNCIAVNNPRQLTGSVDLDSALVSSYPNANRWDYAIGIARNRQADNVIWIEVHPANSHHVSEIISKAKWLRSWLRTNGRPLLELCGKKPELRWVTTGRVAFRKGSKPHLQLGKAGIQFPQRVVNL